MAISGYGERMRRMRPPSYKALQSEVRAAERRDDEVIVTPECVEIHCGWGRLLLAHTFPDSQALVNGLLREAAGERDIALYVDNPHVVLSLAPQSLFLDPSDTYRLWMTEYRPRARPNAGVVVRRASTRSDVEAINRIYRQRKMVPLKSDVFLRQCRSKEVIYLVAEDVRGRIVGSVMGINHIRVFNDPGKGSSLWCLAVAPDCPISGVGESLVRYLAEYFQARGSHSMDLSVLHDNQEAKALYEKLGFQRLTTFAIKRKNAINEPLFARPEVSPDELNPYARIIVKEAQRRGIQVQLDDAEQNLFTLVHGGRQVRCHESLTDLTSAVTMTLCQNKLLTHRVFERIGLRTPRFELYTTPQAADDFLKAEEAIVVKPANGEQGKGISVDIRDTESLKNAIVKSQSVGGDTLLESYFPGQDLRIVVIGYEVVAAAIRRPAEVIGNGRDTLKTLVEKQSRRRQQATGGESVIPMDAETERCLRLSGYTWDSVLPEGQALAVRKTANLHTGGTLEDVTAQLHPVLREVAEQAARALQIPVVGLDLLVKSADQPEYVLIEANERPGLENHAPQPTAERFIDLLFPHSGGPIHDGTV